MVPAYAAFEGVMTVGCVDEDLGNVDFDFIQPKDDIDAAGRKAVLIE